MFAWIQKLTPRLGLGFAVPVLAILLSLGPIKPASADLIFDQDLTLTGQGLGAVLTVVTFNSQGGGAGNAGDTEEGGVSWDGSMDVFDAICDCNTAQTQTRLISELTSTDIADFRIVWNTNEAQNGAAKRIDLEQLVLTIYAPNGDAVFTASLQVTFSTEENTGVGSAGFAFELDAAMQAAGAAFFLSANRIGLSGLASFVDDGLDTLRIASIATSVPEPATLLLFGIGLIGLTFVARRRRRFAP